MLTATAVLVGLVSVASLVICFATRRWQASPDTLIEAIDGLLPQTQCAQCGFPGCRPYAEAIARGDATTTQCPPGGEATAKALDQLLGPSNAASTRFQPHDRLARVDESACIGCARCLVACPVDAIVGAAQFMHTVIASECTGCELCVPACPVDCIDLVPRSPSACA